MGVLKKTGKIKSVSGKIISGIKQADLVLINKEIKRIAERSEGLDIQVRNREISGDELMRILVQIENSRVVVVGEIWTVVQGLVGKIKEQVEGLDKQDIVKLATVLGIMVDKAQLIQGGATIRVGREGERKLGLMDRMKLYHELGGAVKAKPGRPVDGSKADA